MNYNNKVLHFVLLTFVCLFIFSIFIHLNKIKSNTVNNLSIVKDVLNPINKVNSKNIKDSLASLILVNDSNSNTNINKILTKQFNYFSIPGRLTNFSTDSNNTVLNNFIFNLKNQSANPSKKIRIAYLGDSMIEGDLVSQTLRRLLQQKFGGHGVGFVPITSIVSNFRVSVKHQFSTNWRESNFRTKISTIPLFLSGKVFFSKGYNWVEMEDKTTNKPLEKYIFTGYKTNTGQVIYNKIYNSLNSNKPLNKTLLDSNYSSKLRIETTDQNLPIYGISFESKKGVIVDNFSFRGSGGFEFIHIDTTFLKSIQKEQPYDLIILQYGANVLNSSTIENFDWYYKSMISSLNKLKNAFPNTEFLLVGSADKAFKYPDGIHTANGLASLISTQQKIAFDAGIAFFNTYETMGGYNSIVNWANRYPPLAAKDYTHLSFKGAEELGVKIFGSMMHEYNKK